MISFKMMMLLSLFGVTITPEGPNSGGAQDA